MKILHKIVKFRTQILLLIVAFTIMSTSVWMYTKNYTQIETELNLCENEIKIKGEISSYPDASEKSVSFNVYVCESDCEYLVGKEIYATVTECEGKTDSFGYEDKVEFYTKPGTKNGNLNPGAFDYDKYLFSKGLVARGFVKFDNVKITKAKESLGTKINDLRNNFTADAQKYLSSENAGLVTAIVSGNRDGIANDDTDALKRSGIYHIVAISGLHLNLFIFMVTYFIAKLKIKRLKKAFLTLLATIAVGIFVLIFTGFGISVYRALIMMIVLSASALISRDYSAKNSLFISGFIIVTLMPYSLWNTGFLLSFLSTLSVLVSIDVLRAASKHKSLNKLSKSYAANTAVISFMSIVFTLPVTATSFGYITVYSWLTNLLVLPVIPYFLGASAIFALLSAFGADMLAQILAYALETVSQYILFVAHYVADLPGSTPTMNSYTACLTIGFITAFASTIYVALKKNMKKALIIILIFTVASGTFLQYNSKENRLRITFADVGQGECTLIEIDNKAVMIDCGTGKNSAELLSDAVSDTVRARNVDEIDALIITHFHNDHTNMLPEIAKQYKINNLLIPKYFDKNESEAQNIYKMVLETAVTYHINVCYISENSYIDFSHDARIEILSPSEQMFYKSNDMSAVIRLTYGENTFLFCGDIENNGIDSLEHFDAQCDVLKVPHHGGYCDSLDDFVDSTDCHTAIISCGQNNIYGHPKPQTLSALENAGCEIFRTDTDGAITVVADKSKIIEIETMK